MLYTGRMPVMEFIRENKQPLIWLYIAVVFYILGAISA